MLRCSVIIPTYNPRPDYLLEVLSALAAQTMLHWELEVIIVDNSSTVAVAPIVAESAIPEAKIIRETRQGLTYARHCGVLCSTAEVLVFLDDDNVIVPSYLDTAVRFLEQHPSVGALGGRIIPRYEGIAPIWIEEFSNLLACRDLKRELEISRCSSAEGARLKSYPICAPVGAGMVLRRRALSKWINIAGESGLSDRKGQSLSSSGDNEIVMQVLMNGFEVAYTNALLLHHLIPAVRYSPDYLQRLNYGIQKSWTQFLRHYGICPWKELSPIGVFSRKCLAWLKLKAWNGPVERIRWAGTCGHYDGRSVH